MKLPSRAQAEIFIEEGQALNPGPWVQHSRFVGQAAEAIACHVQDLDPEAAYILGLLHDVGRRAGSSDMRHILDGYTFLAGQGFDDAARICLTHSYPVQKLEAMAGKWDGSPQDQEFVRAYLAGCTYDAYDRLIQLCDAVALPCGFCLLEKRVVDVALRHGVNEYSVLRWQAFLAIQQEYEKLAGQSIYRLLPGVVENTFGNNLCVEERSSC
jgi:hypothetical protein